MRVHARVWECPLRACGSAKQRPTEAVGLPLYGCPDCGGPVTNPRHVLCEACQAGAGHTAEVRQSRGRAIAARKRALRDRVAAFGGDLGPATYRERIWPRLGAVKLAEIMEASGYSKGHCSTIRAGTCTPHVSTWPAQGPVRLSPHGIDDLFGHAELARCAHEAILSHRSARNCQFCWVVSYGPFRWGVRWSCGCPN